MARRHKRAKAWSGGTFVIQAPQRSSGFASRTRHGDRHNTCFGAQLQPEVPSPVPHACTLRRRRCEPPAVRPAKVVGLMPGVVNNMHFPMKSRVHYYHPMTASPSSYAEVVAGLRDDAGLTLEEIASASGVGVRQANNWASGTSKPRGPGVERLLTLRYIVSNLSLVYTPEGVDVWLHSPNRRLKGATPLKLLAAGKAPAVLSLIDELVEV